MSLNSQKILGIDITTSPKKIILEYIQKYLSSEIHDGRKMSQNIIQPLVIVTPNAEQIVFARSHPYFAKLLNQADVALPDGVGVVFTSRLLRKRTDIDNHAFVANRIPGVEFMEDLVGIAVNRGSRIGLIGGYRGVADEALECLQKTYPKLQGWAKDGPSIEIGNNGEIQIKVGNVKSSDEYFTQVAEQIVRTKTQMVFVALGAPKQEVFIERLRHELSLRFRDSVNPLILMSVGGSFDIIAGRLKRAPVFIRSIGFEWFWRLVAEPWRWRRQLALVTFIFLVLKEKVLPH
jgi:N-acetylglucosaminyldiphosphoundecaprenol N-acetyl-beta-D-mannosaminyltransferase